MYTIRELVTHSDNGLGILQEDFFFNPFSSDVISPNCNGFHYTFQEQNLLKLIVLLLKKQDWDHKAAPSAIIYCAATCSCCRGGSL